MTMGDADEESPIAGGSVAGLPPGRPDLDEGAMRVGNDMRYEIRPATSGDIGELVKMQTALQQSTLRTGTRMLRLSPYSTARLNEYYRAQVSDDHTHLLVATTSEVDHPVGMGMGKIWVHADYVPPRSGELIDIWVEPSYRRRGLGGRIVRRLLDFFHLRRVEFLAVNYVHGNGSAEALWRKLGFSPVLITATAERSQAMAAIGPAMSHIAPVVCRRSAAAEQVVAVASLSGVGACRQLCGAGKVQE